MHTEWQGSRQRAPASALPACQSSPLSADRSLLGLLVPFVWDCHRLCCRAPSERWVNVCPGNAAFPQLQCQPGSSEKAAEQTYRLVLSPHLYTGQVTGACVALFRVGYQPPHQHLVNSGGQQTSVTIQFAHLICDHLPLGLNWFIFFGQLSSLGILGLLSPDSFSMAWGISYSVWLKKPFFPPPPPSFSFLHSFQGQTAWVFPKSFHSLLVPHVSMMPLAGPSTCMAESIKSQRSLKRRINVSFASEGST